jgi:very-short-patch-repair endonuclease
MVAKNYALFHRCLNAMHPGWVAEHRFHPVRKWRFDFARPERLLAIEIDGGVWTKGRHSRGAGQVADMEKQSEAACLGWRIIRITPDQTKRPETFDLIRRAVSYF